MFFMMLVVMFFVMLCFWFFMVLFMVYGIKIWKMHIATSMVFMFMLMFTIRNIQQSSQNYTNLREIIVNEHSIRV